MANLRKKIDKGIAYLKKNGVRATAVRFCRKIYLSREADYGKWLKAQRKRRAGEERGLSEEQSRRLKEIEERICTATPGGKPARIDAECFYLFTEPGSRLETDALQVYGRAILEHPDADLFYCDSDTVSGDGMSLGSVQCKPDFDEYYLQSTDYIGGGFLVSGRIAEVPGSGGDLYDVLWRCIERAQQIVHVPEVLYHQPEKAERTDLTDVLRAHFERTGTDAEVSPGIQPWTKKITFHYAEPPLVSILIPNRDHREDLETCISSIRKFAGYEPYEILILENNSTSEEIHDFYETLQKTEQNVRVISYEGGFNFSKINNFGAKKAKGEYLLFLNNDTEMISRGCLSELMNYARQPEVGAVGAQLFYGDDTVQHAGVIVGYGGTAGHAFEGVDKKQAKEITPMICARSYSAVTAACMVVRRSLFEALGGFDEKLGVAYNDIDLCLRIGAAGKKVLYTPYAQLYHYESKTRGLELTQEKAKRVRCETEFFRERWEELLKLGDPCYSPNLTLEKPDFSLRR